MTPEQIVAFIKHNSIDIKKDSLDSIVDQYIKANRYAINQSVKKAVDFLSNNSVVKFEVGKTYKNNSVCDSNCWFSFKIEHRSDKFVWIVTDRELKRRKVSVYDGVELIYPHGKHSMCLILRATDLS